MKTLAIMAIPLSQGFFALVDGDDYEELSKFKWHADKHGKTYLKPEVELSETPVIDGFQANAPVEGEETED